ncbi:MAG: enoyl-CoA hydratase/isomerase family protein [Pseudomonadota bacterium]|nr:enoyl-CoA hydratase/isomerase family protein [Pseudomonadota bacterium]
MPDYKHLSTRIIDNAIAIAAFNRPDAANALNAQMALEINDLFASLSTGIRAVILTGEGRHFCAGADLKERKGMDEAQWHRQHHAFEEALKAIMACEIPVIAAVNGAAMGGGLELALTCDFIYAAENARFALTETTLGIIPGMGGTQRLPRAVGMARAKELIFSGKSFTAAEALEWGMVNRICPPESLMGKALACAATIAANAPLAVKSAKKSINEGINLTIPQALQCELAHYAPLLPTADRREGIDAFNEKRKPRFTGN